MIFGFSKREFWIGFILLAICYALGLNIDLMEVDAAQYGSISMEMLKRGDFLQVFHRGADYLDKPPLLFWTSAFSFWIFGYSNIAFKLFSLLATCLGAVSVFQFTRLYYNARAAQIATVIFITNVAVMLINNDVRTDTLLMGSCAFAVWMMGAYLKSDQYKYLIGIGLATGLAMLAKGPIGLMVPLSAVGIHLLFTSKWQKIFDWRWMIPIVVTALILLPMCWGLYQQFDLQPEKIVNGKQGVSGLYFYFWEQSFGRITGESVWKDDTTVFYFLHTFVWAFIPWIFCFIAALYDFLKNAIQRRKTHLKEYFVLTAILIPFLVLSLSHYKLPHYIFIVLPFTSIFTAVYLSRISNATINRLLVGSIFLWILSALLWPVLIVWAFPGAHLFWYVIFALMMISSLFWLIRKSVSLEKLIGINIMIFLSFAVLLNGFFYPRLLEYQSSSVIGKFYQEQELPGNDLFTFRIHGHALDFYSGGLSSQIDDSSELVELLEERSGCWVYTNGVGKTDLEKGGFRTEVLREISSFKVTKLSTKFLDPATRERTLGKVFLLQVEK